MDVKSAIELAIKRIEFRTFSDKQASVISCFFLIGLYFMRPVLSLFLLEIVSKVNNTNSSTRLKTLRKHVEFTHTLSYSR